MRKYLVFLFVMLVAASCGTAPPEETDWCWTFDFTQGQGGFNVPAGGWYDEIGLLSGAGVLSFSYEHDTFVSPAIVFVTVARPDSITGDIPVTAAGTIFGVSAANSVTMPGASDEETVWKLPETVGDAGDFINVSIDVGSQEIIVKEIRIEGNGQTPFPSNPCADPAEIPTSTPTIVPTDFEPSPTNTPTPTVTPSPTFTPSITNTPSPSEWCYTFDFTSQSYATIGAYTGWYLGNYGTGYVGGQGWQSEDLGGIQELLYLNLVFPIDVNLTRVSWQVTSAATNSGSAVWQPNISLGSFLDGINVGIFFLNLSGQPVNQTFIWNGSRTSDRIQITSNPLITPPLYYSEVYIRGLGDAPFPSLTNECDTSGTSTPTIEPTTTKTPVATMTSAVKTPIVKNTAVPTVDLTLVSPTPANTLPVTPTYITSTYAPSLTPFATAIPGEGTPTVSPEQAEENTAEYEILDHMQNTFDFFSNTAGNLFDFLGAVFGWIVQSIADLFKMIYDFFNFIFGLIAAMFAVFLEIVQIILLVIQLLFGLLGLLLLYINQLIARLTALFAAFFYAPPLPVPGLPLCISDPMAYDICAVYYIADYTIFAPNTPGQWIIPLVWALMNILIIFRAVKFILKFIKRGEDVTR
jgi:hypothetical protein